MSTKLKLIRNIDPDYLKEVYLYINHTRVSYPLQHHESADFICRRFSREELEQINRGYTLNLNPINVAQEIRERNGVDLRELYIDYLNNSHKIFREVQIQNRICDLVLINKKNLEVTAIEIKANGDDIKKAINQCYDYANWADYVYLLIEEKRRPEAESLPFKKKGIGLIVYETSFKIYWKARKNKIARDYVIHSLSTTKLRNLLSEYGLSKSGLKNDLIIRMKKHNIPLVSLKKALFFNSG